MEALVLQKPAVQLDKDHDLRFTVFMNIVELSGLRVSFNNNGTTLPAVQGADFTIREGECLALVGESGCGKSVSAFSFLGLCPGEVSFRSYTFNDETVDFSNSDDVRRLRGRDIGFVFQDALAALDPVFTIGAQMREALADPVSREEDDDKIRRMLVRVGIPDPDARMRSYPHQLSGGMRQRVMIAIALLNTPALLIADEPTTSLDVTIQAQILELFKEMRKTSGMGMLFITHDLGIVADIADRVAVMYAGRVVEQGPVDRVLSSPLHPYTRGLLASVPEMESGGGGRFPIIPGVVPSLKEISAMSGCLFLPRCASAGEKCSELPLLSDINSGHACACHYPACGGQNA